MVQLKLFNDRALLTQAVCFNSCMVQLKFDPQSKCSVYSSCFNSCMVQLKSGRPRRGGCFPHRFNSCMVQLKSAAPPLLRAARVVLIPVWCQRVYIHELFNPFWVQFKFKKQFLHLTVSGF